MPLDLINIGLAFLEGFALIISPCILPILPILLAGSLEGSHKRPIGIVIGFVLAFALFTFFSRQLVRYSGIDLTIIRNVSFVLLLLLGIIMISDVLTEKFAQLTRRLATSGSSFEKVNDSQSGFLSGVVFGGLIGLIWTPCAGPILAAVIVQSVLQKTTLSSFFVVLAFGIGAGLPMLLIALFGRTILNHFSFIKKNTGLFRKILGVIIILSVFYMFFGEGFTFGFKKDVVVENNKQLINGIKEPYPAPPLGGISAWINSSPLTIDQLRGKVILIDFWTYSCINCIRTFPYLKDWYSKYHDKGFEIIGVHTPEFDFEKNLENVKNAVKKFDLKYPVALDNDFVTWQNYHNQYWPAHYLIDRNGNVVYQHFGEGKYAETENNIRFLLGIDETAQTSQSGEEKFNFGQTPETYLGYARMDNYASPETILYNQVKNYTFPSNLRENAWALQGPWVISLQKITSGGANAALKIHFRARKVFIVMGSANGFVINVQIQLNGNEVVQEQGKDVKNSSIAVKDHTLYEAIDLSHSNSAVLQLTASAPGLEVYTFTFGN